MKGKSLKDFGLAALVTAMFAASPSLADDATPIGKGADDLPLFDAHMHYSAPAWDPYPEKTVIELMDKSGVAMALVSSTPDEGTIRLLEFAPNRIVPEVRPYHGDANSSNWTEAPGMLAYIRKRLGDHPHRGIGEFHIHALDLADRELLKEIAGIAAERKIPVHIHSRAEPVRYFYAMQPGLTIIWAHAGMQDTPETIGQMMDRYPTLYADTSYRETEILGDGKVLHEGWRKVLVKHATRFMVGSDTWANGQWEQYEELIALNRRWLSLLPGKAAENIAYRNAERLFGRKVDRELIGTR